MDEQLFKIIVIIALVKFIFTAHQRAPEERDAPRMMGNGAFGTRRPRRGAFGSK